MLDKNELLYKQMLEEGFSKKFIEDFKNGNIDYDDFTYYKTLYDYCYDAFMEDICKIYGCTKYKGVQNIKEIVNELVELIDHDKMKNYLIEKYIDFYSESFIEVKGFGLLRFNEPKY